jgi:hypothetical protein
MRKIGQKPSINVFISLHFEGPNFMSHNFSPSTMLFSLVAEGVDVFGT